MSSERRGSIRRFAAAVLSLALLSSPAAGQVRAGEHMMAPVDTVEAEVLARATLMTIHDANETGNYTVLRDLGAPGFRRRHVSDVAQLLKPLRARKLDLSMAAMARVRLTSVITSPDGRLLRMQGRFETRPDIVTFDFMFEREGEQWAHSAIGVGLRAK